MEDGSQAYDFDSFEQLVNANIFYGKSIKDIWNLVTLLSIDAFRCARTTAILFRVMPKESQHSDFLSVVICFY